MKRALVTGASSGIGREFAKQLAAQGFTITGVARRESNLETLMQELPGDQHDYLIADLSSSDSVKGVAEHMEKTRYQVLINNAGYSVLEPFYKSDLALQKNILDVNCGALVTLSHAFLQQSKAGDALINLASIVAYLPTPAQPMYSASKAFIASFSECLWDEHRARDVYVMGLCPGVTESEFIQVASGGNSDGNEIPGLFIQRVEDMVSEAMSALKKRKKAIVIAGRVNRIMTRLMPSIMSRHRLLKVLSVMGDPEKAL